MALDTAVRERLEQALRVVDEHGTNGPRLVDDARRLWRRVWRLLSMNLLASPPDADALELACWSIYLPQRRGRFTPAGRPARATHRDRAEEAAEQLVELVGGDVDESLLDRATRLLQEMPHRPPMLDEAKLLADAVNLDDFGVIGIVQQSVQHARQGEGVAQLADGCEKREQYGYWDARLKDGFYFEAVRAIALRRLEHARHVCQLLRDELREDEA